MTRLEILTVELNRLFDLFNEHFYSGAINKPVIAVQTNGKDRRTMGWCTCDKVWKDHTENEFYYEVTICSEYLFRDINAICATLLHEMVHLYNLEHNIKDNSRGRTYHNKRFKETAEAHGLKVSYDERIGWSITELTEEAAAYVEENADKNAFVLTRGRHAASREPGMSASGEDGTDEGTEEPAEPKAKQSLRKYACPECGTIIRASKEVKVICAECKQLFVQQ